MSPATTIPTRLFVRAGKRHKMFGALVLLPLTIAATASAQTTSSGSAPSNAAGQGGAGASNGSTGTGTSTGGQTATSYQFFPGGVAPTPPGQNLGGGNAEYSSSKPIRGNEEDSFDFKPNEKSNTVHGSEDGSFVFDSGGRETVTRGTNTNVHVVRKGDTLWDICDSYFQNPYQWPRIWSYNPQIQNPHWIYPGDRVLLKQGAEPTTQALVMSGKAPATASLVGRKKELPKNTIFLRNEGYIDDEQPAWGSIAGAREDKMFLSNYDELYLKIEKNHEPKVGQELTIYRPIRNVGKGKLVAIQGTATIDRYDEKEHIARARITETLDVIERGAQIGPVERSFEVVPPVRDEVDVDAKIVGSIVPQELYGQNQVLFIDKGEESGLVPGNRLIVVRKGDEWHQSLTTSSSARRIALEDPSPAAIESVPGPRDTSKLPEEVVAELRVISVRKKASMVLVVASRREIATGEMAIARKGY